MPMLFLNQGSSQLNAEDYSERSLESPQEKILSDTANNLKENTEEMAEINLETVLLYRERPQIGDEIGQLTIPVINATLPIFHGTDEDELERGVGHYRGSVLPGEPDHTILSGHRDTVFRELKDVEIGDELIVATSAGQFAYEVVDIYIVDAEDTTVIRPTGKPTISLTTCYPFNFIGNAPDRYIIEGELVAFELN